MLTNRPKIDDADSPRIGCRVCLVWEDAPLGSTSEVGCYPLRFHRSFFQKPKGRLNGTCWVGSIDPMDERSNGWTGWWLVSASSARHLGPRIPPLEFLLLVEKKLYCAVWQGRRFRTVRLVPRSRSVEFMRPRILLMRALIHRLHFQSHLQALALSRCSSIGSMNRTHVCQTNRSAWESA